MSMDPVDTWSEYAFVISVNVVFLAALLTAIWKAVKRRFSPLASGLLAVFGGSVADGRSRAKRHSG